MTRKRTLALGVLAGAIATALIGGIAWAAIPAVQGGVIQGCYDSGGNLKVVEALPCPNKYTPLPWNQQGPAGTNGTNGTNGTDGASVKSESEPAGGNCANGGSKFTAANGVTYACNGADGTATLVANADEGGNLRGGTTPGVTVAKLATGAFSVNFGQVVRACVRVASLGMATNGATGVPPAAGLGLPGEITTFNDVFDIDGHTIDVLTFDSAGTQADRPFHIAAYC